MCKNKIIFEIDTQSLIWDEYFSYIATVKTDQHCSVWWLFFDLQLCFRHQNILTVSSWLPGVPSSSLEKTLLPLRKNRYGITQRVQTWATPSYSSSLRAGPNPGLTLTTSRSTSVSRAFARSTRSTWRGWIQTSPPSPTTSRSFSTSSTNWQTSAAWSTRDQQTPMLPTTSPGSRKKSTRYSDDRHLRNRWIRSVLIFWFLLPIRHKHP